MKARWLTLFACVPLIVGTMVLTSCGGVGGAASSASSPGSNSATQAFLALLTPQQKTATYVGADVCGSASCHGGAPASTSPSAVHLASMTRALSGPETGQYTTWKLTDHYQHGVTCESCHGPGSVHAAQPTDSNGNPYGILTFPNIAQTAVCGQCHGPEHDDWAASVHSQLVADPIQSVQSSPTADGVTSRCEACHGGLSRAEYTENGIDYSTLTSAQIVTLATNILNTIPNTAVCATCHDPHAKTGNLSAISGQDVQIYHSEFLSDSSGIAPNTVPTQYTEVNQICGQCHNGRATNGTDAYLSTSASTSRPGAHHSDQFNSLLGVGGAEDAAGPPQRTTSHAAIPGQCATCHMGSGSSHTMTVNTNTGCQPCHTSEDASNRLVALKTTIVNDLTALSTTMQNWAKATPGLGDPEDWDYTSNITDGATIPNESLIPIQVRRARHNYYYIVISGDYGVHNYAYEEYLIQVANENMAQLTTVVQPSDVASIPMATKMNVIQQARSKAMNSASQ